MSEKPAPGRVILVSRGQDERENASLRVAAVEDGAMTDFFTYTAEALNGERLKGSVFKGTAVFVSDETQSCYIDIGQEKSAVLYAKDASYAAFGSSPRPIGSLFRGGRPIVVQIERDTVGKKGPRATAKISIAGELAALLPGCPYPVSVSSKITNQNKRDSLKAVAQSALPNHGFSAIVRTRAQRADPEALKNEIAALLDKWNSIDADAKAARPPALIMGAISPLAKIAGLAIRNNATVVADHSSDVKELSMLLAASIIHGAREPVTLFNETYPIFAFYGVADDVESVSRRFVRLRSGGEIVIDAAEALTAIDVNLGSAKAIKDGGDLLLRVNTEAVVEAARQIRFRDIGGIVVIDAIRMKERTSYDAVIKALRAEANKDAKRVTVAGVTKLGLIELSRAYF